VPPAAVAEMRGRNAGADVTRVVHHDPISGHIRAQFVATGELGLAADKSATEQGIIALRLRLQVVDPAG
jgi:hypothetical protein